jgi:hypothetical protein
LKELDNSVQDVDNSDVDELEEDKLAEDEGVVVSSPIILILLF